MRTIDSQLRADAQTFKELMIALGKRRPVRDPIAQACEEMQFTPPQVHALIWLGQEGAMTMGQLARRICLSEKTITGIVDRLEAQGHLQRLRSQVDRRVTHVDLTDAGKQTFQKLDVLIDEKFGRIMSLLDPPDRQALFRIIEKLTLRLGEIPGHVETEQHEDKR